MESNNTNTPNIQELDFLGTNSRRVVTPKFDGMTTHTTQGFFNPNSSWNSLTKITTPNNSLLLEVNLIENGIEIIHRSIGNSVTELSPLDSISKDIYVISEGKLFFKKRIKGKYVAPASATYSFDE